MVDRALAATPSPSPRQVVQALRTGEQAWDHCGLNAAFIKMDAVDAKKAPRKQRAEKFGAQQRTERRSSTALVPHAPCTTCSPARHRPERVERAVGGGEEQSRLGLHGVRSIRGCSTLLWGCRGR